MTVTDIELDDLEELNQAEPNDEAAEQAGRDAGWIHCDRHQFHAILPNVDVECLKPVCSDCRVPVEGLIEYTDHRDWNVTDSPNGPIERLLPYSWVRLWLQKHTSNASDLVVKWSQEHPEYVHDRDPRGRLSIGGGVPVRLDDGDFMTIVDEMHTGHDGRRKTTVQLLRLPLRALSIDEVQGIANRLNQILKHASGEA